MRTIVKISFLLALSMLFSCEDLITPDCGDCTEYKPDRATLTIKVGGIGSDSRVRITIYEGHIEDNVILYTEMVSSEIDFEFSVPLNKTFTATALYIIGSDRYTTIDEATPRIKLDEESCEEPCYFIEGSNMNLRLKYY